MSGEKCIFFENSNCKLKYHCVLPEFNDSHNCEGNVQKCSFLAKPKLKQNQYNTCPKIIIKQIENVYLVKADAIVYPTNNLLGIDDPLFNKMTLGQAQKVFNKIVKNQNIKMGFPYVVPSQPNWHNKQDHIFLAVVAGASRLVNEADIASTMKKSLLWADELGLKKILILPCDNGTHDIALTALAQLSAIFAICQKHNFQKIESIYICMSDEESEQVFVEYYNRIFGAQHESGNKTTITKSD